MTASQASFEFTNDRPAPADGRLIVRIPTGLNRKRRVLAEYARQLRFPGYFGWNWDAFEECLRDLSWLDETREIVIVHRDVPFGNSPEQREVYISILHGLVASRDARDPKVHVIFPRREEQAMNHVLRDLKES